MNETLFLLAACLSLVACSSVEMEVVTSADSMIVDVEGIEINVGDAVGVRIGEEGDRVDLVSSDPTILGVHPAGRQRQFVLAGGAAGRASIEVTVDGDREDDIPVLVRAR